MCSGTTGQAGARDTSGTVWGWLVVTLHLWRGSRRGLLCMMCVFFGRVQGLCASPQRGLCFSSHRSLLRSQLCRSAAGLRLFVERSLRVLGAPRWQPIRVTDRPRRCDPT